MTGWARRYQKDYCGDNGDSKFCRDKQKKRWSVCIIAIIVTISIHSLSRVSQSICLNHNEGVFAINFSFTIIINMSGCLVSP